MVAEEKKQQSVSVTVSPDYLFSDSAWLSALLKKKTNKKVKMAILLSSSSPSFSPQIHTHARTQTHTQSLHTHSPEFHPCGTEPSQAMPGQTRLSRARGRRKKMLVFRFPHLALQNGCQAYHKAPCSAQFLFLIRLLSFRRAHISLASSSVSVETSPLAILVFSSYPGGMKANV